MRNKVMRKTKERWVNAVENYLRRLVWRDKWQRTEGLEGVEAYAGCGAVGKKNTRIEDCS